MTAALRALPILLLPVLVALLVACSSPEDQVAGHLAKARALMAKQQNDKAKLEAKNALQILPKNAEGHFILAQLAWRESDFNAAFPQLQMAVASDPTLLEARLRLGDLYYATGDAKSAAEQAKAAKALAPGSAEVRLLNGKVLFLQGDAPGAMVEIDAALAANPAFVDAITGKAGLLSARRDNAAALAVIDAGIARTQGKDAEVLRDARLQLLLSTGQTAAYETGLRGMIQAFPDRPKYRYQLLDLYTAQGRRDDQQRLLGELVASDPKNQPLKVRLAAVLVLKKDTVGAEQLLKDGLAKWPDSIDLQLGLGDLYRYSKRSADAMAAYRKAADRWPVTTPEGLRARNRLVAQHTVDGNIDQARTGIAAILKAAPDDGEALQSRATFAFVNGQYQSAIADLRGVLRRQQSAAALLLLARSYTGAGDLVVANDTYRLLLAAYPNNAEAAKDLAVLYSAQNDTSGATEILRKFVSVNPDNLQGSAALVQSLQAQRDVEAAEAEARRMIERGTGGIRAEQLLGQLLQAQGSNDEALARYKAILEKDPGQVPALDGLVSILLATGRANEAVNYLGRYPRGDINASLLLGKAYVRQGDAVAARKVLEAAIGQHPAEGRLYAALATLSASDSPEQLAVLERGWKASPGDLVVGLALASSDERKGKLDEAIAIYEVLLKTNPLNVMVVNNLASLLLDQRQDLPSLARALALAKPLVSEGDAITMDTLGWAYYRNGDYRNAVTQLERALAAGGGKDPMLDYHLGKAYASAGNATKARLHLTRAIRRGGDGAAFATDARDALTRLGS